MEKRLPARHLIAYGLPGLPLAALTLPLYVVVPTFYSEAVGLSLSVIGAVLLAIRVFDAINDPLIGWAADHWPRKFRRKMWLGLACGPLAVASWALFWPPQGADALWLAASAGLLSVFYTAMILPYSAWGAELSESYTERSRIVAWREGFVLAGTLVAIALPFSIGWKDQGSLHGLALIAIMVAILLPVATILALMVVPEPVRQPRKQATSLSFASGLAAMRSNRHFFRLIIAFFVNSLANALPATLFLLYVGRNLGHDAWRGPLLVLYFAAAIVGMPLWTWLASRSSKHRIWMIAMSLNCLFFLPAAFLGEGDMAIFTLICVATGLCLGADLVLPSSMQADVIEVDSISSGESRAALYFSIWSLASKFALALAVGISFPLLDLAGFVAVPQDISEREGTLTLAMLYALAPVVLKLAAIAIMYGYSLDAQSLARLRANTGETTANRDQRFFDAPVDLATSGK